LDEKIQGLKSVRERLKICYGELLTKILQNLGECEGGLKGLKARWD